MDHSTGYVRFKAMANRNPMMAEVPTHDQLLGAGCDVKPNGYMTCDGKEFNPAIVNPEILPEALQALFGELKAEAEPCDSADSEAPAVEPEATVGQEHQESKVCDDCEQPLPIERFRRVRGGRHVGVCKDCERQRRKAARKQVGKEPTPPVFVKNHTDYGWISKRRARELVIEAYQRGLAEGLAKTVPDEDDVTLDDLLQAPAISDR